MQAIVKERPGTDWVVKDVAVPEIGPDDVLIRVKAVGICGTDVPILKGIRNVPYPLIPGHEFAGDIVKKGANVKGFEEGDRVTPAIVIYCDTCYYCRRGLESLCDNIIETGIHVDGAFAEYVKVPAKVLHKLPEGMSYEEAASVDPLASAYHVVKQTNIGSEDTVLVFGAGPIGLYAIQVLKAEGAKKIIAVGTSRSFNRLELAKELGADEVIQSDKEDVLERVKELTKGDLVDVIVEATGNHHVFNTMIDCVRKGGEILLAGIFHAPASANIDQVVRKEITIKGSICYTWQDYKECLDLIDAKRVQIDSIVTHSFPLAEIDNAMKVIDNRESIKVILYP